MVVLSFGKQEPGGSPCQQGHSRSLCPSCFWESTCEPTASASPSGVRDVSFRCGRRGFTGRSRAAESKALHLVDRSVSLELGAPEVWQEDVNQRGGA